MFPVWTITVYYKISKPPSNAFYPAVVFTDSAIAQCTCHFLDVHTLVGPEVLPQDRKSWFSNPIGCLIDSSFRTITIYWVLVA